MIKKLLALCLFCTTLMAMEEKRFAVSGDNVFSIETAAAGAQIFSLRVRGKQIASSHLKSVSPSKACVHEFCPCGTYAAASWTDFADDPEFQKEIVIVYCMPDAVAKKELLPYATFVIMQQARVSAGFSAQRAGCKLKIKQYHGSGVYTEVICVPLSCQCTN